MIPVRLRKQRCFGIGRIVAFCCLIVLARAAAAQEILLDQFTTAPQTDGHVEAIAIGFNKAYIGGQFEHVNGALRHNLAAFDLDTGALDTAWTPQVDGIVHALAVQPDGEAVYIGGEFTQVNGVARRALAGLEQADGVKSGHTLLGWTGATGDGSVFALTATDSRLYAGGDFTLVNGVGRNRLAAFTLAGNIQGGGLDAKWNPDVGGTQFPVVKTIVAYGGHVYAGGEGFTSVNNGGHLNHQITRNCLAAFYSAGVGTGDGLADFNWDAGFAGSARIEALAVDGFYLYVGGSFARLNGGAVFRSNLAAIGLAETGSHGTADSHWNPNVGGSTVFALASKAGRVYAGGQFTTVNGLAVDYANLAAIEPAGNSRTGLVKTDWIWPVGGGGNLGIYCLTTEPAGLLAGGEYSQIGTETVQSLAHFVAVRLLHPNAAAPVDWLHYD